MSVGQTRAANIQNAMRELLAQQWAGELFRDVTEHQAGSARLAERLRPIDAASHAFRPFLSPPMPLALSSAHGCHVVDVDGNSYLDCHLGFSAQALHGHNPGPVVEYVQERLGRGVGNGNLPPVELDLVLLLREFLPHCEKFAFLNSGTDAIRSAIRLARGHSGRRMVAKFEGTIHGSDELAVHNTAFWNHGQPLAPFPPIGEDGVERIPADVGVPVAEQRDLLVLPNNTEDAVRLIEQHADELACVLAEPSASSFPFEETTLPMVKQVSETCRRLGVLFVLDEVLTGFRCGIGGAAQEYGISADLYCYGKVLSGLGMPLAAVGGRADILDLTQTTGVPILDVGKKTSLPGTHTGNYLALCASYASLSLLQKKAGTYYEETRAKVATIRDRLARFRSEHDIPLRLVGFGDFMGAFQFLPQDSYTDYRDYALSSNPAMTLLTLMLRLKGVYMLSSPLLFLGGGHQEADVDTLVDAVTGSALELKRYGFPFSLSVKTA